MKLSISGKIQSWIECVGCGSYYDLGNHWTGERLVAREKLDSPKQVITRKLESMSEDLIKQTQ
jgi:glycyl-tRNA synthetase (class II)